VFIAYQGRIQVYVDHKRDVVPDTLFADVMCQIGKGFEIVAFSSQQRYVLRVGQIGRILRGAC
jgi:hypothetical protein